MRHVPSECEETLCLDVGRCSAASSTDIIKLLNGDGWIWSSSPGIIVAAGCRCQLCSQDTHWWHFSVSVDARHNHEADYDAFATAWVFVCCFVREESGCSPRKALPGQSSSAPSTSSSSRCAASVGYYDAFVTNGGLLFGGEWLLHVRKALPTALRSGWAAALSSRSVDIIAAGPSGVNKHAIHDYVRIVCGRLFFPPGGTAAAALRLGAAARRGHRCCRSLVGELARHTP